MASKKGWKLVALHFSVRVPTPGPLAESPRWTQTGATSHLQVSTINLLGQHQRHEMYHHRVPAWLDCCHLYEAVWLSTSSVTDPGFLSIPDPTTKEVENLFRRHKFIKIGNYFFEHVQKMFFSQFTKIIVLFSQRNSNRLPRNTDRNRKNLSRSQNSTGKYKYYFPTA
jgi:hypothetical protein